MLERRALRSDDRRPQARSVKPGMGSGGSRDRRQAAGAVLFGRSTDFHRGKNLLDPRSANYAVLATRRWASADGSTADCHATAAAEGCWRRGLQWCTPPGILEGQAQMAGQRSEMRQCPAASGPPGRGRTAPRMRSLLICVGGNGDISCGPTCCWR